MPNPIDVNPASQVCVLVEFSYETPETVYRYAAWEESVDFDGGTFEPLPELEVELPKQDGSVRGVDAIIRMIEAAPISFMRSTFPPVTVTIWEMDPGDESTAYIAYRGEISRVEFNHNGLPGTTQVTVSGPKRRLETTISFKLSQFCPHSFGQIPCLYDREGTKEQRTIESIEGNKITLNAPLTQLDPAFWKFGGVRYRGFEVNIHRFEDATTLYTVKPVPLHWLNEQVDLLHGCDKTPFACRARGQENNFSGIGLKIPNRDVRISE